MDSRKVYIVGHDNGFESFYRDYGWVMTNDPCSADLLQFTGGEDVTPAIYNCPNTNSYYNWKRDLEEAGYFAIARRLNIPMVGVCRGGQFLNVMCGGAMHQHVEGHSQSHEIHTANGSMMATSTHHQMMCPSDRAKLLAWGSIIGVDPEVVYYEQERCLCFQPHPEYRRYKDLEEYFFGLIDNLLLG